jgi:hypothetical protein
MGCGWEVDGCVTVCADAYVIVTIFALIYDMTLWWAICGLLRLW